MPRPLCFPIASSFPLMKLSISAKCKMEQRWHHFHQITSDTNTTDSLAPLPHPFALGGCQAPQHFLAPPPSTCSSFRCHGFSHFHFWSTMTQNVGHLRLTPNHPLATPPPPSPPFPKPLPPVLALSLPNHLPRTSVCSICRMLQIARKITSCAFSYYRNVHKKMDVMKKSE